MGMFGWLRKTSVLLLWTLAISMLMPVVSYATSVMSFIYEPVTPEIYQPDFTGYVLTTDPDSVSVQAKSNGSAANIDYHQITDVFYDDNNAKYYYLNYFNYMDAAPDSLTVNVEGNSYNLPGVLDPNDWKKSTVYNSSVTVELDTYRMPGQLLIPSVTGVTYLPANTYLPAGSDIVSFTPAKIDYYDAEGFIVDFPYSNSANTTFNSDEVVDTDFEIYDLTVNESVYLHDYVLGSREIAFDLDYDSPLIQGHQYLLKLSPTSSGNEILLPPDGVYTASVRIGFWGSGWPPYSINNSFDGINSVYFRNIVIGHPVDGDSGAGEVPEDNDTSSDPGNGEDSDNDTPSDQGGSSSGNSNAASDTPNLPASDTPASNDQLIVNEESLMNGTKDKVSVDIDNGEKQVLLPVNTIDIVGDRNLELKNEQFSAVIPPGLLKKLLSQVSREQLEGAQISFSIEPLDESKTDELLSRSGDHSNTNIKAAGDVYEFKLSILTADGKTLTLSQFDQPITLRLKVSKNANPALLGVYYIADDGSLEYVGGELDGDEIVVHVSHFSKYAVLEYDKTFNDVPASFWASGVIKELTAKHIISGVSNLEFAPQKQMTRAEVATLIMRTLGLKSSMPAAFADVESNSPYADAIAAATEAEIIHGRNSATFAPNDLITREEMAVMIIKAYEYKHGQTIKQVVATSYTDRQAAATWALPYIDAAKNAGFVHGYSNGQFAPKQFMTRAEGAQIVYQLLKSN